MKKIFLGLIIIIILAAVYGGYHKLTHKKTPQGASNAGVHQAPPVPVAIPIQKDVVIYHEFTGQTKAVEQVDIVARVTGYLEKIHFTDGSDIKKGDILFTIEKENYQSLRDQAAAQLMSSESELTRAQVDFKRFQEAVRTDAVSKQELTTKKAELDKAQAAVIANKAMLTQAELNLSYTQIYSPIDGRINRHMIDAGNLVGGASGNTLLATIVKLSPMYVYFNINEALLYEALSEKTISDKQKVPFYFAVGNEEGFPHEGVLNYVDNVVDFSTGTITVRGEFPNQDKIILPGMFVKLKVPGKIEKNALLVAETALNTDIGGKYLLIVDKDNTVKRCLVKIGQVEGDMRVIESGLKPDDRYIVTGIQFVFPGMKVNPQLIKSK